jgi:hypothetical protein
MIEIVIFPDDTVLSEDPISNEINCKLAKISKLIDWFGAKVPLKKRE